MDTFLGSTAREISANMDGELSNIVHIHRSQRGQIHDYRSYIAQVDRELRENPDIYSIWRSPSQVLDLIPFKIDGEVPSKGRWFSLDVWHPGDRYLKFIDSSFTKPFIPLTRGARTYLEHVGARAHKLTYSELCEVMRIVKAELRNEAMMHNRREL